MTTIRCHTLTPMMELALRFAARHGSLTWCENGWSSPAEPRVKFNSHTIRYLAGHGYLQILSDRHTARVTSAGSGLLNQMARAA